LFLFILVTFTAFSLTAFAQQTELSLVDIITALRSKKATLNEKNEILSEGVKQRGVTFAINPDLEKELRNAGANDNLIAAIRQKSPVVNPVSTPQTKVEPTPMPVSTPRPPDFAFCQNRANANFVMGEYDEAITDYSKAIELNPKESTIFLSRGIAFFNRKNFNQAISDFDKVIELAPDESMAYYNRGNALEKIGNFEKALADYKKASELDADNELAKNAFQRLQAVLPKPNPTPQTTKEAVKQTPQTTETTQDTNQLNPNEPINIGSINDLVIRLTVPVYPPFERQRLTEGLVLVQVTIDEEGKVIAVNATSGPKGLRKTCEDAAKRSKFKPYLVNGQPVKATGFITYNFKAN
jgi:TonB family protein